MTAGVAVATLLGTGAWLLLNGVPWGPSEIAPRAPLEALGEFAAPPGAVAPELFEAFRQASFRYFDLAAAFRRGEIGCERLAAAHGSARSAFDALAAELPAAELPAGEPPAGEPATGEPGADLAPVGGVVAATIREIDASFARSGCETS